MKSLLLLIFRILIKQKRLFVFNLISLSCALTLVILTSTYIVNEISTDKYQSNYNRIYRLVDFKDKKAEIDGNFINVIGTNYPSIDKVCRFFKSSSILSANDNNITIDNLVIVDSTVFDVFDYTIISGNEKHLLNGSDKILLSQSLAKKIFGDQNPIGKPVKINMMVTAYVTGIFADNKYNSHFASDALVSLYTKNIPWTGVIYSGGGGSLQVSLFSYYITLKEKTNSKLLDPLLKQAYQSPFGGEYKTLTLQPLSEIYWDKTIKDYSDHSNFELLILLIIVTLVVVLIAGINYVNLSLSNLKSETKLVGVFKVNGALPDQMLKFYMLSACITFGLSFLVSLLLAIIVLPLFNQLLLSGISLSILFNSSYLLPFAGIIVVMFILIGFYPVLLFTKIKPISLFQGKIKERFRLSTISRVMLTFQFAVSIVLISSVMLIFKQINFMKNYNPGFSSKDLITQEIHYSIRDEKLVNAYSFELLKNPNILDLSVSDGIPFDIHGHSVHLVDNREVTYLNMQCDTSFLRLLNIRLLDGRNFLPSDRNCCIITNKLAKDCAFKNPINQKIGSRLIIGVVNDINGESLRNKIKGIMITPLEDGHSSLSIKVTPLNITNTIDYMKKQWYRFFPEYTFNYNFYDDIISKQYEKEQKLAKSITIIAVLAVILCCLGLLGIVVNMVENRTREIGIRKVNGARILEILSLLNTDIFKWILIAFIISLPVAFYVMNKWLHNFAYKTEMSWWIFFTAGITSLFIALLTVSIQSYRVARRNPIEALRYE